jgi:hypothetical protein
MFNQSIEGQYRLEVLEGDNVIWGSDWKPNLVVDSGLHSLTGTRIHQMFEYCGRGTSNSPNKTSSGAISATLANQTVNADGSIFSVSHVGRVIRFDNPNKYDAIQAKITGYLSPTTVTVINETSPTLSTPTAFAIWDVTETDLTLPVDRQAKTYQSNTLNDDPWGQTLSYFYEFPVNASSQTYNEIGFFKSATGTPMWSRVVLASGVGQRLRVYYSVTVNTQPHNPMGNPYIAITRGITNVHNGVSACSHHAMRKWAGQSVTYNTNILQPALTTMVDSNSIFHSITFTNSTTSNSTAWDNTYGFTVGADHLNVQSVVYDANTYTNTYTASSETSQWSGSPVNTFSLVLRYGSGPTNITVGTMYQCHWDTPFTKSSQDIWVISYRWSWNRVISKNSTEA